MNPWAKWMGPLAGVVVALILAALAVEMVTIPRAKRTMQTVRNKIQSYEGQLALASLFDAEKSFRDKHGFFTTDLSALDLDWAASKDAPQGFEIGFIVASGDPKPKPAGKDSKTADAQAEDSPTEPALSFFSQGNIQDSRKQLPSAEAKLGCASCTASKDHFRAYAIGHWGPRQRLDFWTIDEIHALVHVVDGTDETAK